MVWNYIKGTFKMSTRSKMEANESHREVPVVVWTKRVMRNINSLYETDGQAEKRKKRKGNNTLWKRVREALRRK